MKLRVRAHRPAGRLALRGGESVKLMRPHLHIMNKQICQSTDIDIQREVHVSACKKHDDSQVNSKRACTQHSSCPTCGSIVGCF